MKREKERKRKGKGGRNRKEEERETERTYLCHGPRIYKITGLQYQLS